MGELKHFFTSTRSQLRVIAFLEGVSFLLLLGIAMPLKYMYGQPEMVRVVGMAHGILFVWYGLLIGRTVAAVALYTRFNRLATKKILAQ